MALAWALQAPLSATPAVAQGQPAAQKESSTFQPVPEAIKKPHEEASAADDKGERQQALANDPPPDVLKVVGHPSGSPPWSVISLPLLKGNREEFFLDGSLQPGASGSPVFDGSSQVVGLVYETREYGKKQAQTMVSAYGTSVLRAALQSLAPAPR